MTDQKADYWRGDDFVPPPGSKSSEATQAMPESIVNPEADYSIQPGDPEYDTVQRERRAFLAGFRLGAKHPDSEGVNDEQILDLGFDAGLI